MACGGWLGKTAGQSISTTDVAILAIFIYGLTQRECVAQGGRTGQSNTELQSCEALRIGWGDTCCVENEPWAAAPAMCTPRTALGAAALADRIYAVGGQVRPCNSACSLAGFLSMASVEVLRGCRLYMSGSYQWRLLKCHERAACTTAIVEQLVMMLDWLGVSMAVLLLQWRWCNSW